MEQIKHWQSFGELNNSDAYQKEGKDEFREELPFEGNDDGGFFKTATPRRDFLKYLGFSTAAAALAAGCEIPVKKAIPFANKPEDIVPGIANWYATTFVQDGDAVSVLAKVRDGRPIKIEGNELSPITGGGTSAKVQASVLELYDTARLRFPTFGGKEITLESADKSIGGAIAGPVVLLTSTVNSPTTLQVISQFLAKYPGSRHVQYDGVSYTGLLLANEQSYGKRAIPSYRFDNAKAIVSIGADFLGTWLSPIEFAKQYVVGKKIDEKNPVMSKHFAFETVASLTGSNADERFLHRPSETGAVVAALYNAIKGQAVSGIADDKLKAGIAKAAKELNDNKGAALVVCGSNDVNVQIVVNAINEALGAGGKTIDWSTTLNYKQGIDADFAKLVDDLNAGAVGTLLIHGANPVYTWYDSAKVVSGIKKAKLTVSFNGRIDETAKEVQYVIPDNHFLESWGDAEPKSGYFSLIQPTIHPLFKTRQWQDSLLKWSGSTTDYLSTVKAFWIGKLVNEAGWDQALQDGVINPAAPAAAVAGAYKAGVEAAALSAIAGAKKGGTYELVLYQKVGIGAGQGASNPWLQELPDPITKATWDNYIIVSPSLAKSLLDIDLTNNGQTDDYEVHTAKKQITVTINGKTITLPALIIPGTQKDTIGIAVGYGRNLELGKAAVTDEGVPVGQTVYPYSSYNGTSVQLFVSDVKLELAPDRYDVSLTQTHSTYNTAQGNRTEVMKEFTLAEFKKKPDEVLEDREHELKPFGGLSNYEKEGTIYPTYDSPGIHWGMSVDLNSCVGCGACVIACNAENNIPVVGKREVGRFHDMQWIRIDRYYAGEDVDNPTVVFQPLMCQHCDNAPCENVCPVSATNHSSEGTNQMIYNRCIGTRYCANNCPFKVRRFNWADYTGADSFPHNQVGHISEVTWDMNDDLTRMVLNPDVTVRSRGVIEKCSFCVQRTQEGKLKAKKESRPLKSGENNEWDVKTACQQSCPTNAIVFGNANSKASAITATRASNHYRLYKSLEQLHVLPNVNYLAKVRNRDEEEVKKEA